MDGERGEREGRGKREGRGVVREGKRKINENIIRANVAVKRPI